MTCCRAGACSRRKPIMEEKMTIKHSFFFEGSKEKLQRYVNRAGGMMLDGQRFYVDLKDKKRKQHRAFSFRFHCRFQKTDAGYEIRYFVIPTVFSFIRFVLFVVIMVALLCQSWAYSYLAGGCLTILYCIDIFAQRIQCIRQLIAEIGR